MAPSLVIPDDDTVDQEGAAAPGLDTADQLMDQVTDQSPYDRVRAGCLFALQTLLDRSQCRFQQPAGHSRLLMNMSSAQALQLQQTAKTAYEKQKYTECVEICKEALKLSCNSELLTLVACSQVHCSMLDSAVGDDLLYRNRLVYCLACLARSACCTGLVMVPVITRSTCCAGAACEHEFVTGSYEWPGIGFESYASRVYPQGLQRGTG